jgi:hypothetical protein
MAPLGNALNSVPFFWRTVFIYFKWSLQGLWSLPHTLLITLILLGNLLGSLILRWPFRRDRWKKNYWLVFTNFLSTPVLLAVGVVWAVDTSQVPREQSHISAAWTVNGIFIASAVFGIYLIYRMKNVRWFAASMILISLWLLFWAGFIATMALNGDWL